MDRWKRGQGTAEPTLVDVLEAIAYVDATHEVSTSIVIETAQSDKKYELLCSILCIGMRDNNRGRTCGFTSWTTDYQLLPYVCGEILQALLRLAIELEGNQVID